MQEIFPVPPQSILWMFGKWGQCLRLAEGSLVPVLPLRVRSSPQPILSLYQSTDSLCVFEQLTKPKEEEYFVNTSSSYFIARK